MKKHTREMTLNSSIIKKNAHFSSENYYQLILSNASIVLSIPVGSAEHLNSFN